MEGESNGISLPEARFRQWSLVATVLFEWTKLFTQNERRFEVSQ